MSSKDQQAQLSLAPSSRALLDNVVIEYDLIPASRVKVGQKVYLNDIACEVTGVDISVAGETKITSRSVDSGTSQSQVFTDTDTIRFPDNPTPTKDS